MIEVTHLTKRYGDHEAVSDLSFTIKEGVIYGFLGPNGAGKSTTMNIIAGCLGATSGEVRIDGHSILDDPMKARQCIGYLPEIPPVYMDMTVLEYLKFVAQAKKVAPSQRKAQLENVMHRTHVFDVQHRLIKNLSKGYRQRVGIAQALLGDPKVIILDEPTVGLDPAQIIEIRDLIRELGNTHTVVLSSHILSEVQAVCDAIMIISRGRLVASDTAENLTRLFAGTTTLKLEARMPVNEARQLAESVPGVQVDKVEAREDIACMTLTPAENADPRETLSRAFVQAGHPLIEMTSQRASLEDVFLELTQNDGDALVSEAQCTLGEGDEK